ncbi:LemA family protein [Miniphocaeibacter massiliensis]|uniref:LemA family protein n=1 Tax=Miniphocaeibacter massiliensis TaxID=2041841 RepID=UPI000C07C88D|nr:LemA family protein [Miniphocaeibacter massiliensis]
MKKKILVPIIIVLVVLAAIFMMFIGPYNNLVDLDEQVNEGYSQIETVVQRRADLIPNLVETVKGYATHEEETLTKLTEARTGVKNAKSPEELSKANDEVTKAINIVVEAYPDLKANTNFQSFQDELAGTENRISVARTDYNKVVKTYNAKIRKFPASILAGIMGFDKAEYFKADAGSEKAPEVNFN